MSAITQTSAPPAALDLLNTTEAAKILEISPRTLERSRSTGRLLGFAAPPYRRFGYCTVRYDRADINAWLAAVPLQRNTAGGGVR